MGRKLYLNSPLATGPAQDEEDHFRSAEDALADLKKHRGVPDNCSEIGWASSSA